MSGGTTYLLSPTTCIRPYPSNNVMISPSRRSNRIESTRTSSRTRTSQSGNRSPLACLQVQEPAMSLAAMVAMALLRRYHGFLVPNTTLLRLPSVYEHATGYRQMDCSYVALSAYQCLEYCRSFSRIMSSILWLIQLLSFPSNLRPNIVIVSLSGIATLRRLTSGHIHPTRRKLHDEEL
ncbi:hypothetical protein M422DRAFT_28625 [Sphaerobolus stellatus SS14]|uniref:Uncharacterized protein n=1 Tax=Sphaerobolus stellatus (strain SS14) TaxID=990650 RepID=A0A0C9VVU4_SPHS4|nr:hypothetical protein M422DRAFT_28625 [Sphaerobolus stellatus SS14]